MLFDTGGSGDRPTLLQRLHERGLSPESVRTIVLSHLHFDHVANVECFPEAEILVHEDELAYARQHGGQDPAVPMFQVQGLLSCGRLKSVSGEPAISNGISLIRTPGHTGGHCSLVLESDGGLIVLAQDAVKHRGEVLAGRPTEAFSMADATRSMQRILSIASIVVPGHDCALRLVNGRPEPLAVVRETLTVTLTNRSFQLEP
jgi:glyoxylase-like metal-dependent hydrolase (beta-lactamase superfamily II)